LTAQQAVASIVSSTVARIRTLDQIKPILDKEKERSNSLNLAIKNTAKLMQP
jgi:hypothetical protein